MQLSDIRVLVFEITSYCNVKCPQCSRIDQDGNLAEYVTLNHWDVKKILPNLEIDQLSNLKYVHFEGDTGDALMHPNLEEIVDAFYNSPSKPDITIWTNGALRSQTWWHEFGKKYSDTRLRVQFSIDGLDDTHKLYRVGADYSKAIENAKAFISGGGNAAQRCLIFKHNQHQIEQIIRTSKEVGFLQLSVIPNDLNRFGNSNRWPVFEDGVNTHYIESTTLTNFNEYSYNNSNKQWWPNISHSNNKKETCINFKKGELEITYKGHLIPCCLYNADLYFDHPTNQKFKNLIGDIELIDLHKNSLSSIITSTYFNKLNSMLDNGDHPGRCDTMCGDQLKLKPLQQQIYFFPR
jgi:sulfatase maturation enzyme AslB (radical SAM superfamily)